ncbi:MAG: class I SAM-dependent methyltransferase [Proteobacteria bacterium]|nr:class I SAM-dependent methyltransferase [Pseudomonadota bacterium]
MPTEDPTRVRTYFALPVESLVPRALLPYYRQARSVIKNLLMGSSNERVFGAIYRERLWGEPAETARPYYSGDGSYDPSVESYAALVWRVIAENKVESVLEIGCGDFSVASRYAAACKDYLGIDVVDELVAFNRARHGSGKVRFLHADATRAELPAADLCIVRQVFQHLSNRDIAAILRNTRGCRLLLVTEHLPSVAKLRRPNMDKRACPDVRVTFGSGVYLDRPPFNLPVEVLLDVPIAEFNVSDGERLRTVLIRNPPA